MKQETLPVTNGAVYLRGVSFPVEHILNTQSEIGGVVVGDEDLNRALDVKLENWRNIKGDRRALPAALVVESIPMMHFVPKPITLYTGRPGTPSFNNVGKETGLCLWFAVGRVF